MIADAIVCGSKMQITNLDIYFLLIFSSLMSFVSYVQIFWIIGF